MNWTKIGLASLLLLYVLGQYAAVALLAMLMILVAAVIRTRRRIVDVPAVPPRTNWILHFKNREPHVRNGYIFILRPTTSIIDEVWCVENTDPRTFVEVADENGFVIGSGPLRVYDVVGHEPPFKPEPEIFQRQIKSVSKG